MKLLLIITHLLLCISFGNSLLDSSTSSSTTPSSSSSSTTHSSSSLSSSSSSSNVINPNGYLFSVSSFSNDHYSYQFTIVGLWEPHSNSNDVIFNSTIKLPYVKANFLSADFQQDSILLLCQNGTIYDYLVLVDLKSSQFKEITSISNNLNEYFFQPFLYYQEEMIALMPFYQNTPEKIYMMTLDFKNNSVEYIEMVLPNFSGNGLLLMQGLDKVNNLVITSYQNKEYGIDLIVYDLMKPYSTQRIYKYIKHVKNVDLIFCDRKGNVYLLTEPNDNRNGVISICKVDFVTHNCSVVYNYFIGHEIVEYPQYFLNHESTSITFVSPIIINGANTDTLKFETIYFNNGFDYDSIIIKSTNITNYWSDNNLFITSFSF